jgi:hypothetical protein
VTERCELLKKTAELAMLMGLPVDEVVCPIEDICRGTSCGLIDRDNVRLDLKWKLKQEEEKKKNERGL